MYDLLECIGLIAAGVIAVWFIHNYGGETCSGHENNGKFLSVSGGDTVEKRHVYAWKA